MTERKKNRIVLPLLVICTSISVFILLLITIKHPSVITISILPIVVVGWFWGTWPAVITTVFFFIICQISMTKFHILTATPQEMIGGFMAFCAFLLVGIGIGKFSSLSKKLKTELELRTQLEETLRQNENYLMTIFNFIHAGIMIVDAKTHKIIDINPAMAKILKTEKNKIAGTVCHQHVCPAELGKCPITDLQQTVDNTERFVIRADRERIPVLKSAIPVILNNQKVLLETFYDITDLKKAEKQLQEAQTHLLQSEKLASLGQLAGGVAHEINNPMAVILGFSQSIAKKIKEDDSLYMPLKSIEREAIRCKKLVGDLLTFSRTGKPEKEKAGVNEIIEQTISLIEAQTKIKNIEIIKKYNENLPRIMLNISRIQQVIINLCSNAIDAMPSGGKLFIETNLGDKNVEIKITDTGTGMTDEVKKRLFEPFFSTKEVGKGTGLGLSLCYEIIQSYNGTIEVESESGKGSVFIIKIPVENEGA